MKKRTRGRNELLNIVANMLKHPALLWQPQLHHTYMDRTITVNGQHIDRIVIASEGMGEHGFISSLTIYPTPHADDLTLTMGMQTMLAVTGLKNRKKGWIKQEKRMADLPVEMKDDNRLVIHSIPDNRLRAICAKVIGGLYSVNLLTGAEHQRANTRAGFAFRDREPPGIG